MRKVLFVCIHNSARSQMAEAFLNELGKGDFAAESGGIEKGTLNPLVVKSMLQEGIDISTNQTKEVAEFIKQGKTYDAVITVCDAANAERCPVFPGKIKKVAWFFEDPSALQGTEEEKLRQVALIRDEIKAEVLKFIDAARQPGYWN